jgi:hypothetical protein
MTSGKLVRLPPAPGLTDGPDLRLRRPLPDDVDDMVAQCRDAEFQVRGLLEQRGERRDTWIGSLRPGDPMIGQLDGPRPDRG